MTPPNTLQTHINNIHFHAGVRHPPFFVPRNNVGFNVWTPSNPGMNHAWHINRLHNGGPWSFHGYPGWPANRPPTLLASMMSNPNKYNLLPFNRAILMQGRAPILNGYAGMNGVGFGGQGTMNMPPHLRTWQGYQQQSPAMRYLAQPTHQNLLAQLGLRGRTIPGQNPGQFPFGSAPDTLDPGNALSGMPRSTLQRVTDSVGSLLGRRGIQGPPAIPGFPAGLPRSTPTTRSFPDIERIAKAEAEVVPESREHAEALAALQELRAEIRTFVRENQPLLPATERVVGMLTASIDASLRNPALTHNHVGSSRMFWQSILAMDVHAREDRGMPPSTAVEETVMPSEQESAFIANMQRFFDYELNRRPMPPNATPFRVFLGAPGKIMGECDREIAEDLIRERRANVDISTNVERFRNAHGREVLRFVIIDMHNPVDRNTVDTFNRIFRLLRTTNHPAMNATRLQR